jgi:hypothetical protein
MTALRAVDRYGVSRHGEQYRGWTAIEAGPSTAARAEAEALLARYGGEREALKATHPDRGGSEEAFRKVQDARRILGSVR